MGVDDDGRIYGQLSSSLDKTVVLIEGEPLVFPIDQQFNDTNQNKYYFHPLSENFLRGESEVNKKLREHIATRINYVTIVVAQYLLQLLGHHQYHRELNEEQSSLLKNITEANEKTCINWSEMMKRIIKNSADSGYVKIYLKGSGVLNGETYSRLGIVTFPFYKDLVDGKYNNQILVKDLPVFKKILEFIYPGISKQDTYSYGTRNQIAPFLDVLMMTSAGLANRLNDVIMIYKKYIDDYQELIFNMDWLPYLQDMNDLRADIRMMPELRGNAGTVPVGERSHPQQDLSLRSYVPPTPDPVVQPVQVHQQPPQGYTQPSQMTTPVITPTNVPTIRHNERGAINFGDVVRANPSLLHLNNPMASQMTLPPQVQAYVSQYGTLPPGFNMSGMPGMMPQQRPLPGWAMPQPQMMPQQQPPPPGYQYVLNPSTGQYILVPTPQPQMVPQQQPPPPGYQYMLNPATNQYVLVPIQQQMPQGHPSPNWGFR